MRVLFACSLPLPPPPPPPPTALFSRRIGSERLKSCFSRLRAGRRTVCAVQCAVAPGARA
eukprot:83194-Pyramimonas_sp.AAC.1